MQTYTKKQSIAIARMQGSKNFTSKGNNVTQTLSGTIPITIGQKLSPDNGEIVVGIVTTIKGVYIYRQNPNFTEAPNNAQQYFSPPIYYGWTEKTSPTAS